MIDWNDSVRRYNALGLWHATQYLKTIRTIKDPVETARDVVQDAWITLWKKGKFTKGLFVTVVVGLASNAARDSRPIELTYKRTSDRNAKMTSVFPVQIFGGMIDEIIIDEEIKSPSCGDE